MDDAQDMNRAANATAAADMTSATDTTSATDMSSATDTTSAGDETHAPEQTNEVGVPEHELDRLSDRDLGQIRQQAAEIGRAAPAVDELFRAVDQGLDAERNSRSRSEHAPLRLPTQLAASPYAIVRDQREAMVRAIRLREDGRLSDAARSVWAAVVVRLARLRRDSKAVIAARRQQADPDESGWLASEGESQEAARANEVVRAVPSESGAGLEHLGAGAGGGGDLGRPAASNTPPQGSASDPTVNPHSRA